MAVIKVAEATGPALDWLVAKCEGLTNDTLHWCFYDGEMRSIGAEVPFNPSTNWAQGGPIIDQNKIGFLPSDGHRGSQCCAFIYSPSQHDLAIEDGMTSICWGTTPLIAAMRCYVTSKLGEEVEVPDELLD